MSAVPKPSLSDPISLDGLEPLLDQIFSVQNEFAPDLNSMSRRNDLANAHADFYSTRAVDAESDRNRLLSNQLNEVKDELKSFQYDYKLLQLELAACNDQLAYMPELFSRVLELTAVHAENQLLKAENKALLANIEHMQPKLNQPSMGRRILNRFFGI